MQKIHAFSIWVPALLLGIMIMPVQADEIGWTKLFNESDLAKRFGLQARNWVDVGFTFNPAKPQDRFNGPVTFNDRDRELQLNQFYSYVERVVDKTQNNWSIGGRVDLLFGSDAGFTRTFGSPNGHWDLRLTNQRFYNLASPQAYLELFLPLGTGIDLKLGHFYTLLGNESVMSPDNFFYTHTYTQQFGEPFTHSGLLVEFPLNTDALPGLKGWKVLSKLGAITGGETGGWDAGFDKGLGAWRFLGGLSIKSPDSNHSLDLSTVTGVESETNSAQWNLYSIVYKHKFFQSYEYGLQVDHGWVEASKNRQKANWLGIVNSLTISFSENLAAGLRMEWFYDANDFRVQYPARFGIKLPESGHFAAAVLGLKWQANQQLTIRPNIRYDWSYDTRPFDAATSNQQWLFSMDMILTL